MQNLHRFFLKHGAAALGINNCDNIAPDIAAVVSLKISNEQCLTSGDRKSTTQNSDETSFGESGFEVYIRGFKMADDNGLKKNGPAFSLKKTAGNMVRAMVCLRLFTKVSSRKSVGNSFSTLYGRIIDTRLCRHGHPQTEDEEQVMGPAFNECRTSAEAKSAIDDFKIVKSKSNEGMILTQTFTLQTCQD